MAVRSEALASIVTMQTVYEKVMCRGIDSTR